jgi:hypothetical protein
MSYVDPATILNPNAPPLTEDDLKIQMQDSFRVGRQFIKTAIDPVVPVLPNNYLNLVKILDEQTQGKYKIYFDKLREHFDRPQRPFEAVCLHLFEKPVMITGKDGKEYPHFGWIKLRGEFNTFGEAEQEIQHIMQEHDTYSRTVIHQKGVFFPVTMAEFATQEDMEKRYDQDVKQADDMRKKVIEAERKREQALIKMQEEAEPGSLEDYVRQKIRMCTAETKVTRANMDLKKFEPILARQKSVTAKMETEHPNYYKDGLALYQEKMVEIGHPKPESFFDGCIGTGWS